MLIRHKYIYNNEIRPLLTHIGELEKSAKKTIKDELIKANNSKVTLANLLKSRSTQIIEEVAKSNEDMAISYVQLISDMDREGIIGNCRKRVVAIESNGEETIYENAYKASQDLDIHSGSITKCCQGKDYRVSATSNRNNKLYKFHYEGESIPERRSTERKVRRPNVGKLNKILRSYEQKQDTNLSPDFIVFRNAIPDEL